MGNLKLARETLINNNLKIVIVNQNQVIYTNEGFGIKPLYLAYKTIKTQMEGASCADRVIGKAAAWIYKQAQIKELYCDIITTTARHMLEEANIKVIFVEEVAFIENRDRTGMCPVEAIAKDEASFEELLIKIESFLREKGLL